MPTVIHELADAFLRRKQALAERGQAKTKLAGSDYFMPKSAKEDLNNRLSVFEQGGLPELLKQGASEMYHNPIVNTAISLTPGVGDLQSAFEAIRSARQGNYGEAALNFAGVAPGIPSLGALAGIFAGKGAKTADLPKLFEAQKMASEGLPREEIWNKTGWFQGVDKHWRYEIPDYPAFIKGQGTIGEVAEKRGQQIGNVMYHKEGYRAYPELKEIPFQVKEGLGGAYGRTAAGEPKMLLGYDLPNKSTPLHESTHYIQDVERFASGGNPTQMSNELGLLKDKLDLLEGTKGYKEAKTAENDLWDKIMASTPEQFPDKEISRLTNELNAKYPELQERKNLVNEMLAINPQGIPSHPAAYFDPIQAYERLAGEVEARTVQARMNMTPEELRATPPWEMYPIPEEQQLVRYDNPERLTSKYK